MSARLRSCSIRFRTPLGSWASETLAHGYDIVDPELVWDAVTNRLPELKALVAKLLG